ncbi:hypothetical protein SmJEL517_g00996 [Synchytrium microbalum]|uniref:Ras-GEF domain-containing protein n=1 Tax=Synchytrium microbalum TaxID=1806994 RepID=A0A507CCJ4_9FUNG|nr:uncharacterized protein SmJEL517_g00996 [Synchytrium microbalum]TPX37221.1 hypothetical protein SmJEL517_g00996 [Synchytrium microbalum]
MTFEAAWLQGRPAGSHRDAFSAVANMGADAPETENKEATKSKSPRTDDQTLTGLLTRCQMLKVEVEASMENRKGPASSTTSLTIPPATTTTQEVSPPITPGSTSVSSSPKSSLHTIPELPPVIPRASSVALRRPQSEIQTSSPTLSADIAMPMPVLRPRPQPDGIQPRPKSLPVNMSMTPDIPMSPLIVKYRELSSQLSQSTKPIDDQQQQHPQIPTRPMAGFNVVGRSRAKSISEAEELPSPVSQLRRMSKASVSTTDLPSLNLQQPARADSDTIRMQMAKILAQLQLSVTSTSILAFRTSLVAYQMTLIVHSLFLKIAPNDFLKHKPPHQPSSSIHASTEFFNYTTRIIESSVLEPLLPIDRASCIHSWIKVAACFYGLRNMQSLKAVIAALGTPPMVRLRKTWALVPRKDLATLKGLKELVSEDDNYAQYREWLKTNTRRPTVPYLGVWLHDLTYLTAALSKEGSTGISNDRRVKEVLDQIGFCAGGGRYSKDDLRELASSSSFGWIGRRGGALNPNAPEEVIAVLKDLDEDSMGLFVSHWILSRKWQSERDVDELSLAREPKTDNLATSRDLTGILAGVTPSAATASIDDFAPINPMSPSDPHWRASQDFADYLVGVGLDFSPAELEQVMAFSDTRKRGSNTSLFDAFRSATGLSRTPSRPASVATSAESPKLESIRAASGTLSRPRSRSGPVNPDGVLQRPIHPEGVSRSYPSNNDPYNRSSVASSLASSMEGSDDWSIGSAPDIIEHGDNLTNSPNELRPVRLDRTRRGSSPPRMTPIAPYLGPSPKGSPISTSFGADSVNTKPATIPLPARPRPSVTIPPKPALKSPPPKPARSGRNLNLTPSSPISPIANGVSMLWNGVSGEQQKQPPLPPRPAP